MLRIDRRRFLVLSAGSLAWACTRASDGPDQVSVESLSVIITSPSGLARGDSRQGIMLLNEQTPFLPDDPVVTLTPPDHRPVEVGATVRNIRRGLGGDTDAEQPEGAEDLEILVVRHDFDQPGIWTVEVAFDGISGQAAFQIAPDADAPRVGEAAIASDSPTLTSPGDVDPLCTRDPVCSMHDVSIADALTSGVPTVISFATPRFCTSRTCGPVVDFIEAEKARVGGGVGFVHVEVWKNTTDVGQPGAEVPAFAEWGLGTEPWTYFVGADGVVRDRWLGPVSAAELTLAVDALIDDTL